MEVGWWCEVRGARWDAKGWEPYLQDHLTHGHELLLLKCLPLGRVQGLGTLGRLEPLVQSTTASVCRLGGLLLCGVDVCLFGWVHTVAPAAFISVHVATILRLLCSSLKN